MNGSPQCHAVALDIPWYVNGTLNEDQMSRVENHLGACAACRAAVDEELRRARHYSQFAAATGASLAGPEASLETLLATVAQPGNRMNWRHRWLAAGAVVACVALMLALPSLLLPPREQRAVEYEAMTTTAPAATGIVVQVVFREDAREQEIRRIVSDHGGSIISGPTAKGVYRITLPPEMSEAVVERLLPGLRGESAVLMAEREL